MLAGLLPYYEEGERVDELVEVVEGIEDLGEVMLSKLRNWIVKEMLETKNGNMVDENVQSNDRNALVDNNRVGCSYKKFLACNSKEYDGKGGVVVYTRWVEKMELVQNMSGCGNDKKWSTLMVHLFGKDLTW